MPKIKSARRHASSGLALNLLCAAIPAAWAQTTPSIAVTPPPTAAVAPAPAGAASAPAGAASAPVRRAPPPGSAASAPRAAPAAQTIEITGGRESDTDQRRQSTASKIVIGRDEIDKFGDATVGEVLRRLPGVTTPGAPGRGGPPRMRGLGNGYTQLLIDGQRVPPGFSIESLTPEQVERIEILRAPTAETGAQAIAGTINIVTREGFKRRLNDLRGGFGYENGKVSPGINWTHNDTAGDLTYNLSGSAFFPRRTNSNSTRTTVTNIDSGALLEDRTATSVTDEKRFGANLTSRLQWRLGEGGDQLALTPSVFHTEGTSSTRFSLVKQPTLRPGPDLYDSGNTDSESRFTNARLGLQWRQRVGPVRLEVNGGGGSFKAVNNSVRNEVGTRNRVLEDHGTVREKSVNLTLKGSGLSGGSETGGEHNLVAGAEIDASRRDESKLSLQDRQPLLADYDANLQAQALRLAAYAQDEWNLNPNWGLHAGLRWEGIDTKGDNGRSGPASMPDPNNRSSVWTPLLHAVWKPDPKKRDQIRLSLTRSYRPPSLGTLIARPSINRDYPVGLAGVADRTNPVTSPDTAGNPNLKPELATGLDLAFERYLDAGGVLSASVFHRQISNLMRGVTTLETVSYSTAPRYVRRQQNIGEATASGLEMDAKFRLDQVVPDAPGIEFRANLSLYDSKVKTVPGPDNRLDQQSKATGNVGGDYRLRGIPLTLGGNVNWVPGYTTKTDVGQFVNVSTKRVWDMYALWTFNPAVAVRLLGNNIAPRDYTNTAISEVPGFTGNERTTVASSGPSYLNLQLRLELKL